MRQLPKKVLFCLFLFQCYSELARAQFSLSWSSELQSNYYVYKALANGVVDKSFRTFGAGVDVHYVKNKLECTGGLHLQTFHTGIQIGSLFFRSSSPHALRVPLRLGYKIFFLKKFLCITPSAGMQTFLLPDFPSNQVSTLLIPDSTVFNMTITTKQVNSVGLAAVAACEIEVFCSEQLSLSTYLHYSKGLIDLLRQEVKIENANQSFETVRKTDRGTYLAWWTFRVRYYF